jgi:hypothetical protein
MELDVAWAGTLKAVLRGIVAVQEYEVQTIDVERSGSFSCGSSDSQTDSLIRDAFPFSLPFGPGEIQLVKPTAFAHRVQ